MIGRRLVLPAAVAAINWSKLKPITGGNGLVEFIGLAAPVKTPLIGPPQQP